MSDQIKNPAIQAVFNARPELLNAIIDAGQFDEALVKNIRVFCQPFPIWAITQCWEVIASTTGWGEARKADVEDFRRRNQEVKEIFTERLNAQFAPVDYKRYYEDFNCDGPEETQEDQLVVDSVQELFDAGVRPIDLDLYCAASKFQLDEAERLLKEGANPAAWLPDPFPSGFQLDGRIDDALLLHSQTISQCLYEKDENAPVYQWGLRSLLSWSAYETLYELVEKNRQFPHCES